MEGLADSLREEVGPAGATTCGYGAATGDDDDDEAADGESRGRREKTRRGVACERAADNRPTMRAIERVGGRLI